MKAPIRAALMNALLFPGTGHIHLKRYARGCLFLVPTLAAAAVFMSGAMDQAQVVADQIMAGTMPLDPTLIAAKVESASVNTPWMTVSVYVLIAGWAGSIIDVLLISKDAP
ncbi:MAG: hypothetical protein QFF03_08525 [Pseudomonadota bacterium]|nr:hypothetical protein [Pseudomonadota bacterium]